MFFFFFGGGVEIQVDPHSFFSFSFFFGGGDRVVMFIPVHLVRGGGEKLKCQYMVYLQVH